MEFKVHITNMERLCRIGIDPHEQGVQQRVRFHVEVTLIGDRLPVALEQSVPYDAIVRYIDGLTATHIDLAETYVARIAEYCLGFPAASLVTVRLDKLDVCPAATVGATVTARKPAA